MKQQIRQTRDRIIDYAKSLENEMTQKDIKIATLQKQSKEKDAKLTLLYRTIQKIHPILPYQNSVTHLNSNEKIHQNYMSMFS